MKAKPFIDKSMLRVECPKCKKRRRPTQKEIDLFDIGLSSLKELCHLCDPKKGGLKCSQNG